MSIQTIDNFITANGLQLHYRRWSPPQPNPHLPPILLMHGLASASSIWNFVAPLLAQRGHTVTALDQRGHGESDKPDTGYDFATIIADDHAFIHALDMAHLIIVGHSWGAMVALQYAVSYSDEVSSLVLVDGATNEFSLRPNWSREQAIIDLAPPRFAGTPREAFLSHFRNGPLGQQWTPQLEDTILHIVQLREDNTVAPHLDFNNHLQIIGAMWDQPLFDLYQQARCPIKLVIADRQPLTEAEANFLHLRQQGVAKIQELRPDIHIVTMPNTIHDIPLQRPEQLAEEILSN